MNKTKNKIIFIILLVILISQVSAKIICDEDNKVIDYYDTKYLVSKAKLNSDSKWEEYPKFIDLNPKVKIYEPLKKETFTMQTAIKIEKDGYIIFKNQMRDGGIVLIKDKNNNVYFIQGIDTPKYCPGGDNSACIYNKDGKLLYSYSIKSHSITDYSEIIKHKDYSGKCPDILIKDAKDEDKYFCGLDKTKVEVKKGDIIYFKGEDGNEKAGSGIEIWEYGDCFETECDINSDCGEESYSDNYCSEDNVYRDYLIPVCIEGKCDINKIKELLETCDYECENGECVIPEIKCYNNNDCDDDNKYTYDKCVNPGEVNSYCEYEDIACFEDSDCGFTGFIGDEFCLNNDLFKIFRNSFCVNPGEVNSYCDANHKSKLFHDCGEDECEEWSENFCKDNNVFKKRDCYERGCNEDMCFNILNTEEKLLEECDYECENGECVIPEIKCYNNNDCDDDNKYTYDKCVNPGEVNSYCEYEDIACFEDSDCGNNGLLNQLFCSQGNLFDNYINYKCFNKGYVESFCSFDISDILIKDCGENSCDDWNYYCSGNYRYKQRDCYERGCENSECYSEKSEDNEFVETCEFGCVDGECVNECDIDSDCGEESYSDNYCSEDNVYRDYLIPVCIEGKCDINKIKELLEVCEFGCVDGECVNECDIDSDCGEESYSDNYCSEDNVYRDYLIPVCIEGKCDINKIKELLEVCEFGCVDGECIIPEIKCYNNNDCGENKWIGEKYCYENNIYQDYESFLCENPGTIESNCSSSIESKLIKECDYKCKNGECIKKSSGKDKEYFDDEKSLILKNTNYTKGFDYHKIESIEPVSLGSIQEKSKINYEFLPIILLIFTIIICFLIIILIIRS